MGLFYKIKKSEPPKQSIESRNLSAEDAAGLDSDRTWVAELLKRFDGDFRLVGSREDIPTLHSLLAHGPYSDDAVKELQVFGTVFGDILAREIGLSWVVVTDEHGTDVALQLGEKQIYVFPRDMIIKRIEAGEHPAQLDLDALLIGVEKAVRDQEKAIAA